MKTEVDISRFQDQLRNLEQTIIDLGLSGCDLDSYFRQFLDQCIATLGVGGAVWIMTEKNELGVMTFVNLAAAGLEENGSQSDLMLTAVQNVLQEGNPVVLPAQAGSGEIGVNHSAHNLFFVPVPAAQRTAAVVVLIAPDDIEAHALQGFLGFLMGLCKHAGQFIQQQHIGELREQLNKSNRFRDYFSSLHSSLDPKRSCFALANYAQELLGVFRCMAGSFNSAGKFRMLSVSGLESVAVKSSLIKSISSIARQVCRNKKAILVDNPNTVLGSAKESVGDDLIAEARLYMLQAKLMAMGVFPIICDKKVVGALVVEKAKEEPVDPDERALIDTLLIEAGSALANGLVYRDQPLSWLVRPLTRLRDKVYRMERGRRLFWAAFWLLLVLLPFIVPKQVKVIGTAELIPVQARIAYAQQDGLVETVSVPEDRQVKAGQVLASMDVRIIEAELDRVAHTISATGIALGQATNRMDKIQMRLLTSQLKSYYAEQKKYVLQREQYEITAPVSGTVITRQDKLRLLFSKPVLRGEAILTVVPHETSWELTVNIPEDKSGLLLRAFDQLQAGQHLAAKVILNAYPDIVFRTHVLSVAPRASVLTVGEQKYTNVIEVRVAEPVGLRDRIDPREGLEGKVAIECGKHNLFFALTHEFFDFMRVSFF